MKTTKAESFAVDSTACRVRSKVSRRFIIASSIAPAAPIAPPSVGVATPMKMVPSTRKISARGGTITKVVCSAMADTRRKPVTRSMRAGDERVDRACRECGGKQRPVLVIVGVEVVPGSDKEHDQNGCDVEVPRSEHAIEHGAEKRNDHADRHGQNDKVRAGAHVGLFHQVDTQRTPRTPPARRAATRRARRRARGSRCPQLAGQAPPWDTRR